MAGVTTSSTVSAEFRAYFSKQLLEYPVQKTILDQFAVKQPIPKNGGNKSITMFRWGTPKISDIQTLSEGVTPGSSTASQLALTNITKPLTQYGEQIILTDIMSMTELFNSVEASTKRMGQDIALFNDTVCRNVLCFSNLTAGNGSLGTAAEGGGTYDNSDVPQEYYGQPATTTQTYTGLNADTSTSALNAPAILDLLTKLKKQLAPEVEEGGYVYVTEPRVARDLMRDPDWLNASNYGNAGKPFYRGEVGSIYGVRVVVQTNAFVSLGSATNTDRFIYNPTSGGLATGKDVITSFMFGGQSWGVPMISGSSPFAPNIDVVEGADKADPFNQTKVVAVKTFWAALRMNPNWYLIHRTKTGNTL